VLQDTVSRTAIRVHVYKNVPRSEGAYISVLHLTIGRLRNASLTQIQFTSSLNFQFQEVK
jgi:hypothetical protein